MIRLSFRTKLILAMSLIVVGVTGATMLVTQQRVQETYRRLFEAQFRSQISFFSESQMRRLNDVAAKLAEFGRSVRISSAMEEGDAELIYDNVFTELREYLRPALSTGAPVNRLGRLADFANRGRTGELMPMIRVLDAEGKAIVTTDPRFGLTRKNPVTKALADQIKAYVDRRGNTEFHTQEIGYLMSEGDDGSSVLREFIVTPIVNPTTEQRLGALMIGFPVSDFGEQTMFEFSKDSAFGQLLSGIWLDGTIHSQTIPEAVRPTLAKQISAGIGAAKTTQADQVLAVNGVPHRVFFRILNPDSPLGTACQVCLFSLESALREQNDLRLRIGGFGAAALAGALVLILLISHGLTVPIQELVRGTNEIREGNFNVKVPVRSHDEVGQLATSFNEMAQGLVLNRKYQAVLAQVADKDVAHALMSGEVALGGEVREVSVLFCDIRGFTALTQDMPPAEVIAMLNEHMTALTAVVYEHDGVVDKFVGDLIMAVFGAPKSYGNDAHNAARCALRMLEERQRLNETSAHKITVGIGVATGPAVAGCMGSHDRLNYTVLGERVNLASRLCSTAGRMEVVIDETTRARLANLITTEPLAELRLKGFSQPVQAHKLLEVRRPESSDPA